MYYNNNSILINVSAIMRIKVGDTKYVNNYWETTLMIRQVISGICLPNTGPKATTNNPFPTMCSPKAAGSFSREEYSDIVIVKLIKAAPLTNPHITNQIINIVQSVCSAITAKNRNINEYLHKLLHLTQYENKIVKLKILLFKSKQSKNNKTKAQKSCS